MEANKKNVNEKMPLGLKKEKIPEIKKEEKRPREKTFDSFPFFC